MEQFILKGGRLANEELSDEFYLQVFRQMNRKNKQTEKALKALTCALTLLGVLSRYMVPSKELIDVYEAWLLAYAEKEYDNISLTY